MPELLVPKTLLAWITMGASIATILIALGTVIGSGVRSVQLLDTLQSGVTSLTERIELLHRQQDSEVSAVRDQTRTQMEAIDRRITSLETGRISAEAQLAAMNAAIAGLQAQSTATQAGVNDTKIGVQEIRRFLMQGKDGMKQSEQRHDS